jgi:hypothetical protein
MIEWKEKVQAWHIMEHRERILAEQWEKSPIKVW